MLDAEIHNRDSLKSFIPCPQIFN